MSHLRIAARPEQINTVRVRAGGADLLLGGDLVVSAQHENLETLKEGQSRAVVNMQETYGGDFTRNPNLRLPTLQLARKIESKLGSEHVDFLQASKLATALLGDSIATNLFMVGYTFQKGWLPVSAAALLKAIELNGAAVAMNQKAFEWGRRAAADRAEVERLAAPTVPAPKGQKLSASLDELIQRRVEHLSAYQDAAYAERYRKVIDRVRRTETAKFSGRTDLSAAVARYYAKLLAYKDEYEVARLYVESGFFERLNEMFEGDFQVAFHLAPPLLAKRDPVTGVPRKRQYGGWMGTAFKVLARLKWLRGGALDVFGYSAERRMERELILDYERTLERVLAEVNDANYAIAVELLSLPEEIRGFGHVKLRHLDAVRKREVELLGALRAPATQAMKAAA